MEENILEKAKKIQCLILDVDGVLSDGQIYMDHEKESMKSFSVRDGLGIALLKKVGIKTAIISGRESPILNQRLQMLGIQHIYQGYLHKVPPYEELKAKLQLNDENFAYCGDDIIDVCLLNRVGLAVTPSDCHPSVLDSVDLQTQSKGGEGAIREICDLILHAQNHLEKIIEEFSC